MLSAITNAVLSEVACGKKMLGLTATFGIGGRLSIFKSFDPNLGATRYFKKWGLRIRSHVFFA